MSRPMSFAERQYFIQALAQARNLSVACKEAEPQGSTLRQQCEAVIGRIDNVAGELVGDDSYLRVIEA